MAKKRVWIFACPAPNSVKARVPKGMICNNWVMAEDDCGNFLAKNPTLETLDKSLNSMFKYNWVGYISYA